MNCDGGNATRGKRPRLRVDNVNGDDAVEEHEQPPPLGRDQITMPMDLRVRSHRARHTIDRQRVPQVSLEGSSLGVNNEGPEPRTDGQELSRHGIAQLTEQARS